MTARRTACALLPLAGLLLGAATPQLVPDVSQREIEIRSGFTGAQLLLFGAIAYPGGRLPARPVDVVVVLKGPARSIIVREKRKIAGVWINAADATFRSAPAYYAVASTRPLDTIVPPKLAMIFELGLDNLQLSPTDTLDAGKLRRFEAGLVDLNRRRGLFRQGESAVEVTDQLLYRARLDIPASVPTGRYTAETFLVGDGRVLTSAVRDIDIGKSGFERFVALFAERHAILYGLFAIAVSLALGWFAGFLFRRS